MAWRIKPFRRTGATGQPNIALMEEGEIAVNSYDQKIWMKVGANLIEVANASGATWGNITGTLSNQTDLQNALNAKANDNAVVKTSGNQTGLSGNKTWTGSHQFDNDLRIGTDTDSTSNTRLLTVSSNGFAGLFLNGDASNTSGEPGGSFISLGTDGGEYNTGGTNLYITSINEAGSDGMGGTWPGTTSNSGLIGIPGNYRLQFGINSQINFYCASNQSVVFNGAVEVAGAISTLNGGLTLAGSSNANRRLSFTNTSGVSTSAIESHSTGGLSIWGGDESLSGANFIRLLPRGQHSDTAGLRVNVGGNTAIDGSLTVGSTVTATNLIGTNSDPRLKTNKKKVKARRELIEKLEYWSFEWKRDGTKGRSVMADKVQEIAPEHVHVADDEIGTLSVDKGALALEMVFALIDMLKEEDDAAS